MGLDAFVFCDCYETGKVRTPPPQPELVYVNQDTGGLMLRPEATEADECRFDEWLESACEHEQGQLVSHHIGSSTWVGLIRKVLNRTPEGFPILLDKVVYSGSHCGDALDRRDVENLSAEIDALHNLHCRDPRDRKMLSEFETQMADLIRGSGIVRKPIAF